MGRFSNSESRVVRDICARLGQLDESEPQALPWFLEELSKFVGGERGFSMQFAVAPSHVELEQLHVYKARAEPFREKLRNVTSAAPVGWTTWNPVRPEPAQRNRALSVVNWIGWDGLRDTPVYRAAVGRTEFANHDQLRVLVCDGPALLGWVGTCRRDPFTLHEIKLFQALVPALQRRLKLERHLQMAPLAGPTIDAALEAIPAEAYVCRASGHVVFANAAGRARLDADPHACRTALANAVAGRGDAAFAITTLRAPGVPNEFLAVARSRRPDAASRVAVLARQWSLTPRQAEVLSLLARGLPTKTIAVTLGCSEKTVEIHVSAVLARANVSSRAMLIARIWEADL